MLDPNGYMSDVDFYNHRLQTLENYYAEVLYRYNITKNSGTHFMEGELKLNLSRILLEIEDNQRNLDAIKMKKSMK